MIIANEIFFFNKLPRQYTVYNSSWNTRKSIIVHSIDVNPVVYTMVSIIGTELRHKYITLAFAKMINHKQKPQKLLKSLMKELDKCDPIK